MEPLSPWEQKNGTLKKLKKIPLKRRRVNGGGPPYWGENINGRGASKNLEDSNSIKIGWFEGRGTLGWIPNLKTERLVNSSSNTGRGEALNKGVENYSAFGVNGKDAGIRLSTVNADFFNRGKKEERGRGDEEIVQGTTSRQETYPVSVRGGRSAGGK